MPRSRTLAKLERRFALIGVTGVVRMALSALDMALWDALAVAAGVPLAALLGAAPRPIPAYNSCGLGLMAPEAVADEAEKLLAGGFTAVKLRLGYPTLADDLAATRAVRRRVPDSVSIMVDYNQALTVAQALERGRALAAEGIAWIEEPIRHDNLAGHATLTRDLATPIQIGENFDGPKAMAQALAAGACDLVMPDAARIGGVTGWQQAAGVAAAYDIEMSSHLMPELSAHLLAATPDGALARICRLGRHHPRRAARAPRRRHHRVGETGHRARLERRRGRALPLGQVDTRVGKAKRAHACAR